MHGESVGVAVTPTVAIAYAIVAAFLFALSRAPAMFEMPAAMPTMAHKGVSSMPAE